MGNTLENPEIAGKPRKILIHDPSKFYNISKFISITHHTGHFLRG
jgi:hypothetical protein